MDDTRVAKIDELVSSGRFDDALVLCTCVAEAAASSGPSNSTLRWNLKQANILLLARRYDACKAVCERWANQYPEEFGPLLLQCLVGLREYRRCAQAMSSFGPVMATSVPALIAHGTALVQTQAARAGEILAEALRRDPLSVTAFDTIVEGWLLPPAAQVQLVESLMLPREYECVRLSYLARIRLEAIPRLDTFPDMGRGIVPEPWRQYRLAYAAHCRGDLRVSERHCRKAMELSSGLHRDATCLLLRVLTDSHNAASLFEVAHKVLQQSPSSAIAAYAIGCYYSQISKADVAAKYLIRAAELDPLMAPPLIGYAHCLARLEEGEKALDMYRRASCLFPGLEIVGVYIAMQYARNHADNVALSYLNSASQNHDCVIAALNEIGVIHYQHRHFKDAIQCFEMALQFTNGDVHRLGEYYDCVIYNLASSYRKDGEWETALRYYQQYQSLRPHSVAGLAALGLTHHLIGHVTAAIDCYHQALAIRPETAVMDLLDRALQEDCLRNTQQWIADEHQRVRAAPSTFSHNDSGMSDLSSIPAAGASVERGGFTAVRPSDGGGASRLPLAPPTALPSAGGVSIGGGSSGRDASAVPNFSPSYSRSLAFS